MRKKVMVAMSGGVDSSVAAALLIEQNYEVIGVTLQIWPSDLPAGESPGYKVCCSLSSIEDARRVAAKLKIPHYVLNFRDIFSKTVINDFIDEYSRGRTPNPCIKCNEHVKFEALRRKALAFECDYLATGHYAGIKWDETSGRYLLLKGIDESKDQSYFLYTMTQEQLKTTLFPVGSLTKNETRRVAHEKGLPVAAKPESQEICFVPDKDYPKFIEQRAPGINKPGEMVFEGKVAGKHKGIINYTIGQRKGLGISAAEPLYVTEIDASKNIVYIGHEKDLYRTEIRIDDINWIKFDMPEEKEFGANAKIRYKSSIEPCRVTLENKTCAKVLFDNPQRAPAPGQAAVFYDGEVVIGGGTIT